jgi:hypothetical protein
MEESYLNYIKKFNNLDIDDKKEEIKNYLNYYILQIRKLII